MSLASLTLLLCMALEVQVVELDGSQMAGRLLSIGESSVVIATTVGQRELSFEEIARVDTSVTPTPNPFTEIQMIDGTKMAAESFVATEEIATIGKTQGQSWNFNRRYVRSVRFRMDNVTEEAWNRLFQETHQGDILVIRKGDHLDYLEGIVQNVNKDQLEFDLDGEVINVALTKLEGVIFYNAKPYVGGSLCSLTTSEGDRLLATRLRMLEDSLELEVLGSTLSIPKDRVVRIDFGVGNVAYLSDLEPRQTILTPWIGEGDASDSLLQMNYRPRLDVAFSGEPLSLDFPNKGRRQTYAKGLALHANSELAFAVDPQWTRLRGWIGVDPDVKMVAEAELRVLGDRKLLYETTLIQGQPPKQLNVEIEGAQTIRLILSSGNDGDFGDRIHFCNLRVTK